MELGSLTNLIQACNRQQIKIPERILATIVAQVNKRNRILDIKRVRLLASQAS